MHASASGVTLPGTSPAERSHHRRRVSETPRSVLGELPGEGKDQMTALREEKLKQKKEGGKEKDFEED